jgi:hypothetical protein
VLTVTSVGPTLMALAVLALNTNRQTSPTAQRPDPTRVSAGAPIGGASDRDPVPSARWDLPRHPVGVTAPLTGALEFLEPGTDDTDHHAPAPLHRGTSRHPGAAAS